MHKPILGILIILLFSLMSCIDTENNDKGKELDVPDSVGSKKTLQFNSDQIGEVIQNFSSPIEMAALINEAGVPFSKEVLCPTDNFDIYNTNFKRALGLGMLGVDLGYLNIYNKPSQIVNYITIIKKLAEEMKVGQFFDFSVLKRLASNSQSIDSLMFLSTNSFNRMDNYLRDSERSHLSSLIVSGVWLEGLYLATQVVKEKYNKEIGERVGEQKIILNDILLLLKHYEQNANFSKLIEDFNEMKDAFANVKITRKEGEPESIEKDGMLVFIQNETSNVEMTKEQLQNIIEKTEKIRNKLIGLK